MLAYEYLKANPRKNAPLLTGKWAELFDDPDCPHGVKEEVLDIQKLTNDITDSVLFFHENHIYNAMVHGKEYHQPHDKIWQQTKWLDIMYSICQNEKELQRKVFILFTRVNLNICELELNYQEWLQIIRYIDYDCSNVMGAVFKGINEYSDNLWNIRGQGERSLADAFNYMSMKFMRRCTINQLNQCIDLFKDVDPPTSPFDSVAEIEAAHEARTEREVAKQLKEHPLKIVYGQIFRGVVEQYGFKLPKTRNDFITRGARHHNCVATYADRHCRFIGNKADEYTRLIFSNEATIELSLKIKHDLIVAVNVPQCKGRYNKDAEQTVSLTQLRIALTGQPVDILSIEETKDGKEKDREDCTDCAYYSGIDCARYESPCPRHYEKRRCTNNPGCAKAGKGECEGCPSFAY